MKTVKFNGQHALVFQEVGELTPGEVKDIPDHVAKRLLVREDFEEVVRSKNRVARRKLDVEKPKP